MRRYNSTRRQAAFTIVEMVIVVLVLGILAAVGAPKYRAALALQRSDALARRVAADLRLARNYARQTSQSQTVTFDAATDGYAMSSMPAPDRPASMYTVALTTPDLVGDIVSVDFGGASSVVFDIYGRPNNAGSVVLRSMGVQKTVQVDAAGTVTIQ